ncbi:hypothetical protein DAEQUDRAFT_765781 [Daedalea quercina L-15889]|uniref:Sfi1 spindle body domain-containing protein n=1 Tax=Daedalea quercina L-15889 TaxID=1314783 RepID=A0A165Q4J4_9APHY|nr:hypothetical protein DAEQUDRAFT_765781 [Daedalea quercina L-15889]
MSRFRPPRASSPAKVVNTPATAVAQELLDESRSTTTSIPELAGLSPEEVDFIEAVVQRAPATATTFLTVFKAYNDILQERGLDPQNEVVYYGKLLKLGTLKGRNWGDKWESIKQQYGYASGAAGGSQRTTRVARGSPAPHRVTTRLTRGLVKTEPEDTFTLHSHLNDTDSAGNATENNTAVPQHHGTPRPARRPFSPAITSTTNSLGLHTGPPTTRYPTATSHPPHRHVPLSTDADSVITGESGIPPSTIPPSYGAAVRSDTPMRPTAHPLSRLAAKGFLSRPASPSPILHTITQPTTAEAERRIHAINEDDAWKKIKEAQDYKEADRFREDKLVERCWDVWKQGYQWIITTHEQIAQARDSLILRLALQRWRQRTAVHQDLYVRVCALSDRRRLKAAMDLWKVTLKEKKQADWRSSMRARMKAVRERREAKILKDAWAKWRQSYQSHLSAQHYNERLVSRFLRQWRTRLAYLDQLDAAAEHLEYARQERQAERCWDLWRRALEVRRQERVMAERVDMRIMGQAMDTWKNRLHQTRVADEFYDVVVVKRALGAWKAARDRIRILENRAVKHVARQDDVLRRAVLRVWKAHERGRLLDRVRNGRLLKQAWAVWKARILKQRELEDLAMAFYSRGSSTVVSAALRKWRGTYSTHQNAANFAVHYHSAQLQYKTLLGWRLQLRAKLKMIKQARIAHKFFLQRTYFKLWLTNVKQQRLQRKRKEFQIRVAQKYFIAWLVVAQKQRQRKIAEEIIRQRIDMRIMSTALSLWLNRVVDIKDRELEVIQMRDRRLLSTSFMQWKALCIRHVEELSLMESYQDVKREENMRRMFYRWLTAARKARHRRLYLQQKEDELKSTVIAAAWDKWRERFLDIRLQPIADDFLVQRQKHLMFRAFGIWHSKTRSLPAVHFDAYHTKLKAWRVWRDAMPNALQARRARDIDRRAVLTKVFEKWHKAYKTKIELKAVARARYLRLPSAAPRQVIERPRTSAFPTRMRSTSPTLVPSCAPADAPIAPAKPFVVKPGIASLLSARTKSPERAGKRDREIPVPRSSRPKLSTRASTTRATSPAGSQASSYGFAKDADAPKSRTRAGSSASGPDIGRSSLWQELRDMQLRSRPFSDRARSIEPP